ncbi:myelin-associated glycoprotein-like isoform X2 [Hypomesus transpacificus]|uniref:myelin-associated glycoprotein-like isoform X2 n=1 Tax=Hypomesus transpacificus TaxID=137520 RepID=UPI001F0863FC|nr:myelin-associated glycoprotein-like isoform X2 [Hypomesus transpacificus]
MDQKDKVLIYIWLGIGVLSQPVFSDGWTATVVKDMTALVSSCVVVPCSFKYTGANRPTSRLSGIWHFKEKPKENIYHEDSVKIVDNFKGRTKLLGSLGEGNCSLMMDQVKDHDNGPFCFRIEIPTHDQYSYVDECVRIAMLSQPLKPTLLAPKTATEGEPFTITCSVMHTCPSEWPSLTWSTGESIITYHRNHGLGKWETLSTLTLLPQEKDDHSEVSCTANFHGGKTSSERFQIFVKRKENIWYIIVPVTVGLGTAVMFGALCVLMRKKYKRQIVELQTRSGNSMWNRFSRMSRRFNSGGSEPGSASTEQRRQQGNVDRRNQTNNTQAISKPRFPSPKSDPKSSCAKSNDYSSRGYDEDASLQNIYGNV